jgi:hypothetical protein
MHTSMALQPFVGPWPRLQFPNLFYADGKTPWTNDQPVARPLPTQTQNKHTDIHALSGIRTHDTSVRTRKTVHALDRAATVIGKAQIPRKIYPLNQ